MSVIHNWTTQELETVWKRHCQGWKPSLIAAELRLRTSQIDGQISILKRAYELNRIGFFNEPTDEVTK